MKEVLGAGAGGVPANAAAAASRLPVMLLSNDNAQILAARAHGLPAYRLSTPGDLSSRLAALSGRPLTASALRALLAPAATVGLGSTAGVSLQTQFDRAVGALRWAAGGLAAAGALLRAAPGGSAGAASAGADEYSGMAAALEAQLEEWEAVVKSHQAPSRLLQWAASPGAAAEESAGNAAQA
eukprot:97546-Chlamydomonas_euryale.AAC.1